MRTRALLLAALLAAAGACSEDEAGAGAVAVRATDDTCTAETTQLPAGSTTFSVKNEGSEVTELYVYDGERVVGEVEDVGPGTTRTLTVDLAAGDYELACKPGERGDGIRQAVTVTA